MLSTRRLLIPLGLTGALVSAVYFYARRIEPRWLDVQELVLRVPDLPPGLDGLRLAHITDPHISRHGPPGVLDRALEAIDAARPDLIALTGDIVDRGTETEIAVEALAPLASRPVFAVFGNHDYRAGSQHVDRMVELLRSRGMRGLRNEAVPFERNGATLWIVGLDYPSGDNAQDGIVEELQSLPRPRLLLTHTAEDVERLPFSSADLALAGHTHGGQIYVPVLTRSLLDRKFGGYAAGSYLVNCIPTYINRGLGTLGMAARFLRRPEVTIFTFRPGEGRSLLTPASKKGRKLGKGLYFGVWPDARRSRPGPVVGPPDPAHARRLRARHVVEEAVADHRAVACRDAEAAGDLAEDPRVRLRVGEVGGVDDLV